jgi:Uma2 family endonuclease
MGERVLRRMIVEEFLRWEGEPNLYYELVDGVPVPMGRLRSLHGTIVVNVAGGIHARLRGRGRCRAEMRAAILISADDCWSADLAVTCSPLRDSELVDRPWLIVEVLSKASRDHDLGRKLPGYQDVPSVQEIWAIDSERRRVWVYRREGERWMIDRYLGSASFASGVVDGELALDDIYENTDL